MNRLGQFIYEEMKRRDMSGRAFADLVGVSHVTINSFLDTSKEIDRQPTIDFLIKLSRATGVDICTLISMVAPDDVTRVDVTARVLVERIAQLSPEDQAIMDRLLLGMAAQNLRESHEGTDLAGTENGDES